MLIEMYKTIKRVLGCYRSNVFKRDFNITSHSKMYGKVWKQVFNWIFQDDATIRVKYDIQQSCRVYRALSFF